MCGCCLWTAARAAHRVWPCPMPSVPIPHTATRKSPTAASPFHLPPCLMASGLGGSYGTNREPLPHHSPQNLLCEHPPSLQTVLPLLSCTMACVTTCLCTVGPFVTQLALTPLQPPPCASSCSCPSPSARLARTHSSGSLQGRHFAPCPVFLSLPRAGMCELVSVTQRRRGTESAVRRASLAHPRWQAAVPADRQLRTSRDEPFPCEVIPGTGVSWCGM